MKIAITGHTSGIGAALSQQFTNRGHEIVGLSKRDGNNIRNIPKICNMIEPCDMFVNNAQAGYAQTELLFEMAHRWTNSRKHIMVISTMMTQDPVCPMPGLDMDQYRVQKFALEEAVKQIRNRRLRIKLTIVRPGSVATSVNQNLTTAANANDWATVLITTFELAASKNLTIPDISLAPL